MIGDGANIGAGVIFANYDGVHKATSTVGAYSFVGSNSVLAAPVHIADGAYVAAGSTITGDVGAGELAVGRGRQRNVPGWVARKRAGTKTARAAEAALDQRQSAKPPADPTGKRRCTISTSRRGQASDRIQEAERQASDAVLGPGLSRAGRRGRRA